METESDKGKSSAASNVAPGDKKTKTGAYMTAADERFPKKLTEEQVYPKIIDATPQSNLQLLLFELPLLFHLPIFLIYSITLDQQVLLIGNVVISFILGMLGCDLMRRFEIHKKYNSSPKVVIIALVIVLLATAFFLYRLINWAIIWDVKRYPVFERLFT